MSTASTGRAREHKVRADPSERFWAKVERGEPDECWPWVAYLYRNGYGMFTPINGGPKVMAHRYAYEVTVGPIPGGLTIDHLCRNRACCNPAHMQPVTRGENAIRGGGLTVAIQRRHERAELACTAGHPRTPEHATREKSSGSWRCRTCRNEKRRTKEWKR